VPVNSVSSSVASTLPDLIHEASCSSVMPAWRAASLIPYTRRYYQEFGATRYWLAPRFEQSALRSSRLTWKEWLQLAINYIPRRPAMRVRFPGIAPKVVCA
jgi:hypothetical protein